MISIFIIWEWNIWRGERETRTAQMIPALIPNIFLVMRESRRTVPRPNARDTDLPMEKRMKLSPLRGKC